MNNEPSQQQQPAPFEPDGEPPEGHKAKLEETRRRREMEPVIRSGRPGRPKAKHEKLRKTLFIYKANYEEAEFHARLRLRNMPTHINQAIYWYNLHCRDEPITDHQIAMYRALRKTLKKQNKLPEVED